MYGATQLGDVDGLFDSIAKVVSKIGGAVKAIRKGGHVVIQAPGLPPIVVDSNDPDALRKAQDAMRALAGTVRVGSGRYEPGFAEGAGAAAGRFLSSPVGMVALAGGALLLLTAMRRR